MSAPPNDGGPAFPVDANLRSGYRQDEGMSLRDWFAGQALPGVMAVCRGDTLAEGETSPQMFARKSYAVADAMLAERARIGGAQ
jgi:hypothetical protein